NVGQWHRSRLVALSLVLALVHVVYGRHGIFPGPAGGAVVLLGRGHGREHALDAEVAQGIDPDVLADLLDRVVGGDQVLRVGEVDAVVAAVLRGRAGDAEVDLLGAG